MNLGQETRAVRTGSSFNSYHVIARILLAPVSFDLDDPLPMGQYAVPHFMRSILVQVEPSADGREVRRHHRLSEDVRYVGSCVISR